MIVGIDPGSVSGAYGLLSSRVAFIECGDLPTAPFSASGKRQINAMALGSLLSLWQRSDGGLLVVVERVAAMPGKGSVGAFKLGCALGIILGALGTLRIPYLLTPATQWKRDLGLSKDKEESRRTALKKWPEACNLLARKKDNNRAEALLIAWWQVKRYL